MQFLCTTVPSTGNTGLCALLALLCIVPYVVATPSAGHPDPKDPLAVSVRLEEADGHVGAVLTWEPPTSATADPVYAVRWGREGCWGAGSKRPDCHLASESFTTTLPATSQQQQQQVQYDYLN